MKQELSTALRMTLVTLLLTGLAYPLLILAGDADVETSGPSLPANAEAVAQGPHRFARAHNFLRFAREEAARRGVPCHWRIEVVPGIGPVDRDVHVPDRLGGQPVRR